MDKLKHVMEDTDWAMVTLGGQGDVHKDFVSERT